MKKLVCAVLLIAFPALAQNDKPNKTQGDHVKSIVGCVVRDGSDIYLRPLSGSSDLVHLSASNLDLASFVGQRVRAQGSEQAPINGSQPSGTQPATQVEKQPPPSTVPSGTPDPNVQVTQLPQSAQAGDGTEGFRGSAPVRELYVSSIEPLAGSCKPSIDKPSRNKKP
jgi:hypothetical protein